MVQKRNPLSFLASPAAAFIVGMLLVGIGYAVWQKSIVHQTRDASFRSQSLQPQIVQSPEAVSTLTSQPFLIAFTSKRTSLADTTQSQNSSIYTIMSNGTNLQQFTWNGTPVLSQDVAFLLPEYQGAPATLLYTHSDGNARSQVFTHEINNPNRRQLTSQGSFFQFSGPTSGYFVGSHYILYVSRQTVNALPQIWSVNTSGQAGPWSGSGVVKSFSSSENYARIRPRLAPIYQEYQNNLVVYAARSSSGNSDLYVLDKNNTTRPLTTTSSAEESEPVFSGDGQTVIYQYKANNKTDIRRIPVSGGSAATLVDGGSYGAYFPTVSINGTVLGYVGELGGQRGIILANAADGSGKTLIFQDNTIQSLAFDPAAMPEPPHVGNGGGNPPPVNTNTLYLPLIKK